MVQKKSKPRQKIIFLIGTSFSGSTLIGSSIIHDRAHFLSEVDRFRAFEQYAPDHLIDECTICHSQELGATCPIFGEDRSHAIKARRGLLDRYLELISPCGQLVIDASKNANWISKLVDAGLRKHADVYAIVVSRNPVAFAYSASETTKEPHWVSVSGWRDNYQHSLRTLQHRYIPFIVTRYESIFFDHKQIGDSISNLIGLKIKFIPGGDGKSSGHLLGGNLGVHLHNSHFRKNSINSLTEFDSKGEEWKIGYYTQRKPTESTRWTEIEKRTALELLCYPGVIEMAVNLGYSLEFIINYFDTKK